MEAARLPDQINAEIALLKKRGAAETHSDRLHRAAETVARMRQSFGRFGITRLADVTGLDRIGIPVWMAVRPNSKTLAVSQGKGLSNAAAQASALMEAAEIATAERATLRTQSTSMRELALGGARVIPLNNLIARGEKPLHEDEPVAWVEGYDLIRETTAWVPAEAATLGAAPREGKRRFWQSSDGLASGNILLEAIVHGLCERIERDACVLWQFSSDREVAERCIEPASLGDEAVDSLVTQVDRAGFRVRLFDITSDVGVPVSFAIIAPKPDGFEKHWKHFDLSGGSGCHPSPARAAIRAITEAAQSRVTSITGARDDYDPNLYATPLRGDLTAYLKADPKGRVYRGDAASPESDGNLEFMLAKLKGAGVRSVVVVPLADDEGFAVAKVVVPELENPPGNRRQRFGRRAITFMARVQ
jgi:ribosomal protein S12 methylthiotransferase accessory factor